MDIRPDTANAIKHSQLCWKVLKTRLSKNDTHLVLIDKYILKVALAFIIEVDRGFFFFFKVYIKSYDNAL